MNHIVTKEIAPTYAERRAAMADQTRARILDACVTILARGVAELSIPAVAREAGVSVPTVYRNFPDKKTLLDQTGEHLRRIRGPYHLPTRLEDVDEVIRGNFEQAASLSETVAAALVSDPILTFRRERGVNQQRVVGMDALLAPHLHDATPTERENIVLMGAVLCSSATLRTFREMTGITPKRAAEIVSFTLARLIGRDSLDDKQPARKGKRKAR